MDHQTFEKQEELSKKYWNTIVFDELSEIYKKLYKKEINLSTDISIKDYRKQLAEKREEQATIVNHWNDYYDKFRIINGTYVHFRLEQSLLMPEGFFAYEYSPKEVIEMLDTSNTNSVKNLREIENLKKRNRIYFDALIILSICLIVILFA